ncbi:Ank3 [Symbiodinium natans]|uniref:Ank3 protein n=1 Tax=Symbiodinium natans TaxID=878477 RepID=A0A812NS73_9DINO|nr:Ank3 [Symbiodinium natans]
MKRKQPTEEPALLRVFKASGEELASIPTDDVVNVQDLKQRLEGLCGLPRFRQRLLHENVDLEDHVKLESAMDLQLVLLGFISASAEQEEELTAVAGSGDVPQLERILQRPQCPDIGANSEEEDETPLCYASSEGHGDAVRLLLEARADANAPNGEGDRPLLLASIHCHPEIVDLLLGARADMDVCGSDEETPLYLAAAEGHLDVACLLLRARADLEATNYDEETPLFTACEFGQQALVALLLRARADPNARDVNGRTPILAACVENHPKIVRLLLQAMAETGLAEPPLCVAARLGRLKVVRVLLAARAELEARDSTGMTPLSVACAGDEVRVAMALLQARAALEARDHLGQTPLWHATDVRGGVRLARLLLEAGARRNISNRYGHTLRQKLAARGSIQILRLLSNRRILRMPRKETSP